MKTNNILDCIRARTPDIDHIYSDSDFRIGLHVFSNGVDEYYGLHEAAEAFRSMLRLNREHGCSRLYLCYPHVDCEDVEERYICGHGAYPT